MRSRRYQACPALLLAFLALFGCATLPAGPPKSIVRPPPQAAPAPAATGPFATLEDEVHRRHGADASGFLLLDRNEDALRWRLALIDSATASIDMQYYVWFGDDLGEIMFKRVIDAANRGVKVRILIDDLNSLLNDAATVKIRDDLLTMIDSHPNLQLRVFNPWTQRDLAGRVGEMLTDMPRMNQRMHNKSMIVDNRAAILGGRNLGNEYFGLNEVFNFHDLDVLGVGPVARQASGIFDLYWNSPWVLAIRDLHVSVTKEQSSAVWRQTVDRLANSRALSQFPIEPQDWTQAWSSVGKQLQPGTSSVYADIPTEEGIRQEMAGILTRMGAAATRELLIENAYIIPDERFIAVLQKLEDKGVGTRIITNSLASHDVPAVNSHYKQWRKPLLEVTDGLYEMRHDAAIKPVVADTPPTVSQFMGLHSKGMVVDRERVYIGSMNFDPRSADINSEMGVLIESRTLAGQLAELFERDMASANSWHVTLDDKGSIVWVNDRETVKRQPARSYRQRVEDVFFMAFPRDLY